MKKQLLTIIALSFSIAAIAQSHITLKSGISFTSFVFKDSESIKTKDLTHVFNNYSAFSYENYIGERNILRAELGLRQAGSKAIIDEVRYHWDFNYLDINLAYLFKIVGNENYGLHIGASPYIGFLLSGEQSIGESYYDVKEDKSIKTIDSGINFLANAQFKVAENIFVSLEYRYGLGLVNIETDDINPDQYSRNNAHSILAGLSFNLSKKDKDESK